ncbi:MAG: ChaB family protein [Gemmatimonadota bacterium]
MSAPISRVARSALLPIAVSALQAALKAAVGLAIGSLAVLASALDSLLDCGLSTVNLFSIRKAREPADTEHPFGHGKAESLAVLLEAVVIAGSALFVGVQGVRRLQEPQPIEGFAQGGLVMAASLLLSLWVSRYLVRRARETGSRILHADSLHYASDVWMSGGVLAALALQSVAGVPWIDPVFSLVVAVWILLQVRPLLRQGVDELMDRDLGGEEREAIERIVAAAPDILDYHRLRTRRAGPQLTVDVHVVICRERPFEEAHAIVTRLEKEIQARIPNVDVLVHADPCSSAPVRCPGPHRAQAAAGRTRLTPVFFESVDELPSGLREELPREAQELYLERFNREYARSGNPDDAAAAAASGLAHDYERRGERWIRRRMSV